MELHDEIEHLEQDTLYDLVACAIIAKVTEVPTSNKVFKEMCVAAGKKIEKEVLEKIVFPQILEDSETLIPKWAFINFVTILEAWMSDILRAILRKYPQKLKKEQVNSSIIIDSTSREECLEKLIEKELIGILYGGPKEVTKRLQEIALIDIENIPELAEVFRLKAVRDILLHNKGIVNKIYLRKSGDTKAKEGDKIKIDAHSLVDSFDIFRSFVTKVSDELVKECKKQKVKI